MLWHRHHQLLLMLVVTPSLLLPVLHLILQPAKAIWSIHSLILTALVTATCGPTLTRSIYLTLHCLLMMVQSLIAQLMHHLEHVVEAVAKVTVVKVVEVDDVRAHVAQGALGLFAHELRIVRRN